MNAIAIFSTSNDRTRWLKRAGKISFWFFFLKGMLWVAAPLVFYFFA